jgi:mRNA interferase MazF
VRPIHLVRLDKWRPAVVLTRETARPHLRQVTVAPITSRVRGLPTEVVVGRRNGLDHDCVVNCDLITTTVTEAVGDHVGYLMADQEAALALAIYLAFELN